ncbi:MAG TPA: DUF2812 domain-containing protein [Clostridiaceae bacterium]
MAAKGMNFLFYSAIGRYLFEEGTPGEYIYRIELLKDSPKHPESRVYIKFMEDTGIECVATYMRWVYFRKKASEGAFDLYSDYESKIKHYKRISSLIGAAVLINLFAALLNVVVGIFLGLTEAYILIYLFPY